VFSLGSPLTIRKLVVLGLVFIAALFLGYYGGNVRVHWQNDRVAWLEQQNSSLYQRVDQLEYQNNILQVELDVERNASRLLQSELRGVLEDKSSITRELAFYQRVMAPELDTNGVAVDSFVVAEAASPETYYFRLILLQLERAQQLVTGTLSVHLSGQIDGQRAELDVLEIADLGDNAHKFTMNYYTLSEGTFRLPESFVPQSVMVRVKVGNSRRLERVYQWQELLNTAKGLGRDMQEEG